MNPENAVEFHNVDIVFSEDKAAETRAVSMLDNGGGREEILAATGAVIGVTGASIDVAEGEICVLMGLSGSGKSTLLRAVNGLNKVTRGSILVRDGENAVDMANCNATDLRRMRTGRIAMVFQQFALLPWRTVAENVGLGLELRGMDKGERNAIVQEKLRLVELDKWADKYAHELSGGMQQRVGLARAFATDADILLMDEPFSALDPLIRTHLQDELLELQRSLKKTIIFVSHDLDEALKIGNRIAIMEAGHIVQYGEAEDIVLNPASGYVADFVAHMNPLDVLKARSLMTSLSDCGLDDNGLIKIDGTGRCRLKTETVDGELNMIVAGKPVPVKSHEVAGVAGECAIMAPSDLSMRKVIDLRHRSGLPVLLEEGGTCVGVCGDAEIYEGILRQSNHQGAGAAENKAQNA